MSNPTQTETVEDGWYRVEFPVTEPQIFAVVGGAVLTHTNTIPVDIVTQDKPGWRWKFTPVVILTTTEHSAMQQQIAELRQQLDEAQAGWETVPEGEHKGKVNCRERTTIVGFRYVSQYENDAFWGAINLPDNWRLQRRKAGSDE